MDWLGLLLNSLPGSYEKTLSDLVSKIAELRDDTGGVPGDKLQILYDWVLVEAGGAISPEAVAAGIAELLNVLQGKNWGPPNPGVGGVV